MKLTKQIYVASPYSHKSKKIMIQRFKDITRIIGILQDTHPYAFIGPITQSHQTAMHMKKSEGSFKHWARRDYTYIYNSQELWVVKLPGWTISVGVQAEIEFAKAIGIPVKYIDPITLKKTGRVCEKI